jgi:hypothetical protein
MDQLLRWTLGAVLLASLAAVPCAAVWLVLTGWRSRSAGWRIAARSAALDTAVLASIALILVVALRPGYGFEPGSEQWNFVPFRDVARSLSGPTWAVQIAVANLAGNALLFLPFGVFLTLRFPNAHVLSLVLVVSALSIGVEVSQAATATGRSSDVTDVVMNTAGGLAGIAAARMFIRRRPSAAVAAHPDAHAATPAIEDPEGHRGGHEWLDRPGGLGRGRPRARLPGRGLADGGAQLSAPQPRHEVRTGAKAGLSVRATGSRLLVGRLGHAFFRRLSPGSAPCVLL